MKTKLEALIREYETKAIYMDSINSAKARRVAITYRKVAHDLRKLLHED